MPDLGAVGPWAWLVGGLVLVGLETLAPGVFLVWLGIAAILTGLADALFGLSWQAGLIVFAVLSLVSVAGGRALTRRKGDVSGEEPLLNRRGEALVGRSFALDRPIAGGEGRIRVDDTVWRVLGPELPAGATVRVVRAEGASLYVESVGSNVSH